MRFLFFLFLFTSLTTWAGDFHDAAFKGPLEKIKQIVNSGVDVDLKGNYNRTALHVALIGNQTEIAKFLIEKGANIHARDENKTTPLHFAAANTLPIVKLLIEKGADINSKDINQATPLHYVLTDPEVVHFLIQKGAEINPKNMFGQTPLQMYKALTKWPARILNPNFNKKTYQKILDAFATNGAI